MVIKIAIQGSMKDPHRAAQVARLLAAMDGMAGAKLEAHWAHEIQQRAAQVPEDGVCEWELSRPEWAEEEPPKPWYN